MFDYSRMIGKIVKGGEILRYQQKCTHLVRVNYLAQKGRVISKVSESGSYWIYSHNLSTLLTDSLSRALPQSTRHSV